MNANATPEHAATIRELGALLHRATENGTLDQLAWTVNPRTINEFCDGVTELLDHPNPTAHAQQIAKRNR